MRLHTFTRAYRYHVLWYVIPVRACKHYPRHITWLPFSPCVCGHRADDKNNRDGVHRDVFSKTIHRCRSLVSTHQVLLQQVCVISGSLYSCRSVRECIRRKLTLLTWDLCALSLWTARCYSVGASVSRLKTAFELKIAQLSQRCESDARAWYIHDRFKHWQTWPYPPVTKYYEVHVIWVPQSGINCAKWVTLHRNVRYGAVLYPPLTSPHFPFPLEVSLLN